MENYKETIPVSLRELREDTTYPSQSIYNDYSKKVIIVPPNKHNKRWWGKNQFPKKPPKNKYFSPDGKILSAGGIFFFEETTQGKGIWVVEEPENGMAVYTDFGGKYDYNDGDILATISREFREETYNTAEVSYALLRTVHPSHYVYITGYDNKPVYMCIVAHINQFNVQFSSQKIRDAKEKILICNPSIPENWYRTADVKFILLRDIISGKQRVSRRLSAILECLNAGSLDYDREVLDFFKGFMNR